MTSAKLSPLRSRAPKVRLWLTVVLAWCTLAVLPSGVPTDAGSAQARSKTVEKQAGTAKKAKKVKAKKVNKVKAKKVKAKKRTVRKSARKVARAGKTARAKSKIRRAAARPTLAHAFGLHKASDPAGLRSSAAFLLDVDSGRVLLDKNGGQVLPIASITKLMTVMVVLDAEQPMREMLTISREDIDRQRNSSSRLPVGTRLSRREMIQLALMSSANRAANALGRNYPGGLKAFVSAMNAKAMLLGLFDTRFADPTGLSGANVSSARDLARLMQAAAEYRILREDSTLDSLRVDTGYRVQRFGNTNPLVNDEQWDVALQKTGYISEAGRCLTMLARIDGRMVAMVFLASQGRLTRIADARRARNWLLSSGELTKMASAGPETTN